MFYGTQRHHRDLFSGDLGIPDITSHVGSVVHTFETMAMMRQLAEQEKRRNSQYLPSKYDQQQEHHNNNTTNTRKYNKLKQKSSKQKLTLSKRLSLSSKNYSFIPKLSQNHKNTMTPSSTLHTYTPTVTTILKNSSNLDDYRRNLYKPSAASTSFNDADNDEESIINKAFNEIFINYGDIGEDDIVAGHEDDYKDVNDEKLIYHKKDSRSVRHHHHHYHLHPPKRTHTTTTAAAKFIS